MAFGGGGGSLDSLQSGIQTGTIQIKGSSHQIKHWQALQLLLHHLGISPGVDDCAEAMLKTRF
jgi:uncharacterized protein (UPF0303 family)